MVHAYITLKTLDSPWRTGSPSLCRCRCGSRSQFVFRAAGWIVACRNRACPYPAAPLCDGNPRQSDAAKYWRWQQGRGN